MFENYSICSRCNVLIDYLGELYTWVGEDGRSACYQEMHTPYDFVNYRSEKFGNDIRAEILWQMSLNSSQESDLGDADTFGYYALFSEFYAILEVDSSGFVDIHMYESPEMAKADWKNIESDYDDWLNSSEDDHYFAEYYGGDTEPDMSDPYDKEYDL